ncbi:hypothetical protein MLD38_014937 [Melastoma candidum]|uniref:Uncharacterized protein n=1 Tax=Melastoma candidum TaxID=119954 RepID=A0ACB9REI1_9MYRT|nr:hypothetical protein MLD38_014937 [Melastoma candidum]
MEFKHRAVDCGPPLSSACPGVFLDEPCRGSAASDSGIRPEAVYEFDRLCVHPYIDRVEVEREYEEIRKDLLALRRRMLEASVRRELMLEREIFLRGGDNSRLTYDDRMIRFLDPSYPLMTRHFEFGYMADQWMFPRSRPSDNIPLHQPQDNTAFDRNSLLPNKPKPDPNLSGTKRTREMNFETVDNAESPMTHLVKKPKRGWVCDLCEVIMPCEKVLNDHLQGKKHKRKEAQLRSEEKDTHTAKDKELKEAQVLGGQLDASLTKDKESSRNAKDGEDTVNCECKESTGPSGKPQFEKDMRKIIDRPVESSDTKATVTGAAVNNSSGKRKFKYWCEMCQVGAVSLVVYASHEKGKKHLVRLRKLGKSQQH